MCQVFPKLKGDTPLKTYMESVMENKKEFLDQLDYTKERCPPCSKIKIYLFQKVLNLDLWLMCAKKTKKNTNNKTFWLKIWKILFLKLSCFVQISNWIILKINAGNLIRWQFKWSGFFCQNLKSRLLFHLELFSKR